MHRTVRTLSFMLVLYGLSYFIVVAVERARGADEPDPEPLT